MTRKQFLKSIGLFLILPGAGRVWKATRPSPYRWVPNNPTGYLSLQELNRIAFEAVRLHDEYVRQLPPDWHPPFEPTLQDFLKQKSETETVFIINQGLVTRPRENPHLISSLQPDRQGEQQRTVLGSAVDPIYPPNDRPVS